MENRAMQIKEKDEEFCSEMTSKILKAPPEDVSYLPHDGVIDEIRWFLRALVCKNQTNSKFRGKGEKFDFFLILISDRLDYN